MLIIFPTISVLPTACKTGVPTIRQCWDKEYFIHQKCGSGGTSYMLPGHLTPAPPKYGSGGPKMCLNTFSLRRQVNQRVAPDITLPWDKSSIHLSSFSPKRLINQEVGVGAPNFTLCQDKIVCTYPPEPLKGMFRSSRRPDSSAAAKMSGYSGTVWNHLVTVTYFGHSRGCHCKRISLYLLEIKLHCST